MIITYFGKQFYKIQHGEMVLALNPVSKNSKSSVSARFGADLVLISVNQEDYNGVDQVSYGDRVPFIINGPGEYEVKGISILGSMSYTEIENKKYINTIYSLTIENIKILFLGAFQSSKESFETTEVDILFLPINSKKFLRPQEAAKLISSLEPKIIIPMDYIEEDLKLFLKEVGQEKAEQVDKLVVKRKDLESKNGEVIIIK